jgi:manganese oxidase
MLTRRHALAALAPVLGAPAIAKLAGVAEAADGHDMHASHDRGAGGAGNAGSAHAGFAPGRRVNYAANGFDPNQVLRDFDQGKVTRTATGKRVCEWTVIAQEKDIEIAPGVTTAAWTYNGRVPGPALRAREGDLLRIHFVNGSGHPHTIHFHGVHPPAMDGVPGLGAGLIDPGRETTYEFEASPFGLHLYHCHATPLAEHIAKGLYGTLLIDPREGREPADELVMVMNGYDTNFDGENEFYAANTIPFAYMQDPIEVKRGELVRVYLVNVLEHDLLNSFHIHGNFFHYYPTGTSLQPAEFTDTVMLCQGQRGIIEMRFPQAGKFMFHAHQSEFTELGWMGFFEVTD